jgi:uncharacterized protein
VLNSYIKSGIFAFKSPEILNLIWPFFKSDLIPKVMKSNNRRDFLRKSVLGLSGIAIIPSALKASVKSPGFASIPAELPERVLGRTGIKTPLFSMGSGGGTSANFVRTAYDSGIRLFFSASYYGEGNNEILVGQGLQGLPRDSYFIGTAAPPEGVDKKTGLFTDAFKADDYMKKAEGCLKRFGLDYIDILLLPYAGKKEMVLHEGVLRTMEELKKQGKIRFAGIASHSDTVEALNAAAGSGIYDVAMIGYNFKTQNRAEMDEAIGIATKAGMGIVAMKTTAGAFWNKSGPPLNTDAAFKWVLNNPDITSIVSGMSTIEEMQKNLKMLSDLKMTEQEKKDLNLTSWDPSTGLYCQQCGTCVSQCRKNLDIPSAMRSYMYAYGYNNTRYAFHTLADAGISVDPCGGCDTCTVSCKAGFNVRGKISDIARLSEVPGDFLRA